MSQETPPEVPSVTASSPYLDQLAQLASPVPNLAATLSTQIEHEADEENVSFLRTRLPTPPPPLDESESYYPIASRSSRSTYMSESSTPPPLRDARTGQVISRTDSESQRRMRRAVAAARQAYQSLDDNDAEPSYASRVSRQSYPSYSGWAPGSSDDESDSQSVLPGGSQSSAQLYNEWSSRMRELRSARSTRGDLSRLLDQVSETHSELEAYLRPSQERRLAPQAAPRSRAHLPLPQYLLDRERNAPNNDESDRSSPRGNNDADTLRLEQRRRQQLLIEMQARAMRAPTESHRQRYMEGACSAGVSKSLEQTIRYLGCIRTCSTEEEQIDAAKDAGLLRQEYAHDWQDFFFHPLTIQPPYESSWFSMGSIFAGTQRAAGASCLTLPHVATRYPSGSDSVSRRRARAERMLQEDASTSYTATSRSRAHPTPAVNLPSISDAVPTGEEWPVKVAIHGVDYSNMTLTGTMEASNVPDKSSPSHESSITTYLEGEIIDFNHFTLETKSFNANARIDATYWRKLEPFKHLSDEQMVKNILSRRWLSEDLMSNYVLMRWKGRQTRRQCMLNQAQLSSEKCFVKPSDAQSSLTISGFYYVSLKRDNGHVEGLYYDPSSTPYQHLSLSAESKRTFPTYTFM